MKLLDKVKQAVDRVDVMFAVTAVFVFMAVIGGLTIGYPGGSWGKVPLVIGIVGTVASAWKLRQNLKP